MNFLKFIAFFFKEIFSIKYNYDIYNKEFIIIIRAFEK